MDHVPWYEHSCFGEPVKPSLQTPVAIPPAFVTDHVALKALKTGQVKTEKQGVRINYEAEISVLVHGL